mgnify:FL=1
MTEISEIRKKHEAQVVGANHVSGYIYLSSVLTISDVDRLFAELDEIRDVVDAGFELGADAETIRTCVYKILKGGGEDEGVA